ncbi:hypothetical protein FS749_014932 [Ceratobasidium sp. UAMH 11750]|nr:hypothetical protein FS749_014932 [Ceratobasidium sp. UAMH 11750]
MEFFGRRKSRPRESSASQSDLSEHSVRYENTTRDRPPVPVGTVSQALRGSTSTSSIISAPTQNPGLTASGTEMNYTRSRRRADLSEGERPTSPSPSNASHSSYGRGMDSPGAVSLAQSAMSRRTRDRDMDATIRASDKRGTASGPGSDFGPPMSPPGSTHHGYGGGHRPSSSLTMKSDTSRGSHYTQAAGSTYSSSWFNKTQDDGFFLDRPSDDDIQSMFLKLGRELDVGSDRLSIDNKWRIIYESERKRWREERDKQPGDKRSTTGGPVLVGANGKDNNGETYIQKFMTNTITPKDIQGLGVSLRTMPLSWLHGFIDIQGIPVLASRLNALNRPGRTRTESETQQETEILKCLKTILNMPVSLLTRLERFNLKCHP